MIKNKDLNFLASVLADKKEDYQILKDIYEDYSEGKLIPYVDYYLYLKRKLVNITEKEAKELISTFHYEDRKVGKTKRALEIINKYL